MKRIHVYLYLFVALAMLLTACGGPAPATTAPAQPQDTQSSEAQPTEAQPTEAQSDATQPTAEQAQPSGDVITLNIWGFAGEYEFLPAIIEQFQAENPNIKIELTDIPESDYVTKVDTALLAKEPPDIGYVYERRWHKTGTFLSLNSYLESQGINISDYNQAILDGSCMYEGKLYCLGTYSGAVLLFYNKTLFDEAGVPYPSSTEPMTFDEYRQMIKQLSKPSDDITKRVWGGDAGAPYWWIDRHAFFSDDGRKIDGYINDEDTINAYQTLVDLRKDGSVMSTSEGQLMEGTDLLAQQKLATSIIDNAVAIPSLETANIKWGAAPLPVEKKGLKPYAPSWTDGYGVFSDSKHPEEAKKFLAYLIKVGNEKRLEQGTLPLNLTLAKEKNYAGNSEGRKEVLEAIEASTVNTIFVPGFWDVIDPSVDGFNQMVDDNRPVSDVLNEIAPQMQEALDENWKTWESIK